MVKMKGIKLNKTVIEGGLNENTLTGFGFVYAVNNRIADTKAKLASLAEKSELTAVQLEQIDVLTERVGELEAALKADDVRPYADWFDAMLASEQAEDWMSRNRTHLAILASWHGGGWLPVNVDRLYTVFTGLLTGDTEKAEAKKALNAFLCIFRKGGDLLKGVKVSVNNAELDTWKAVMLNGFSKDKRSGFVKLSSISLSKFRKQLCLYVLSLYQRESVKVVADPEATEEELTTLKAVTADRKEGEKAPRPEAMTLIGSMSLVTESVLKLPELPTAPAEPQQEAQAE